MPNDSMTFTTFAAQNSAVDEPICSNKKRFNISLLQR